MNHDNTQYHPSIVVFAGQGTSSVDSTHTHALALEDSSTPSGALLLSECHRALLSDLSSLPAAHWDELGLAHADFPTPKSLLFKSPRSKCKDIASGIHLVLVQSLRYLTFVETSRSPSKDGSIPDYDIDQYASSLFSFCGFSSGILPACVAATSRSTLDCISKSVEAFRVAFWIGVHTELYRIHSTRDLRPLDEDSDTRSWSYVFLGMDRGAALDTLRQFEEVNPFYVSPQPSQY